MTPKKGQKRTSTATRKSVRAKSNRASEKIEQALSILKSVDIPIDSLSKRKKERLAMALLAVAKIKPSSAWKDAQCWEGPGSWGLTTRETIEFWNNYYGENLSRG